MDSIFNTRFRNRFQTALPVISHFDCSFTAGTGLKPFALVVRVFYKNRTDSDGDTIYNPVLLTYNFDAIDLQPFLKKLDKFIEKYISNINSTYGEI